MWWVMHKIITIFWSFFEGLSLSYLLASIQLHNRRPLVDRLLTVSRFFVTCLDKFGHPKNRKIISVNNFYAIKSKITQFCKFVLIIMVILIIMIHNCVHFISSERLSKSTIKVVEFSIIWKCSVWCIFLKKRIN